MSARDELAQLFAATAGEGDVILMDSATEQPTSTAYDLADAVLLQGVQLTEFAVSEGALEMGRLVIVKQLRPDAEVSIRVDALPNDLPLIDMLGMLAFAQHMVAIGHMVATERGE